MTKKTKVRTLELTRPPTVLALEGKINTAIQKRKISGAPIRLFQHDDGSYTSELVERFLSEAV